HSIVEPIRDLFKDEPRAFIGQDGRQRMWTGPRDHTDALGATAEVASFFMPVPKAGMLGGIGVEANAVRAAEETFGLGVLSQAEIEALENTGQHLMHVQWFDANGALKYEFDLVSGMGEAFERVADPVLRREIGMFFHTEAKFSSMAWKHVQAG